MKYWFRQRRFGLGLVPATWQGWLTIALYIATLGLGVNLFPPANYPGWVLLFTIGVPTAAFWYVLSRKSAPFRWPQFPADKYCTDDQNCHCNRDKP